MTQAKDFAIQISQSWHSFSADIGREEPHRISGEFCRVHIQSVFGVNPDFGRLQRWIEDAIHSVVNYARGM